MFDYLDPAAAAGTNTDASFLRTPRLVLSTSPPGRTPESPRLTHRQSAVLALPIPPFPAQSTFSHSHSQRRSIEGAIPTTPPRPQRFLLQAPVTYAYSLPVAIPACVVEGEVCTRSYRAGVLDRRRREPSQMVW